MKIEIENQVAVTRGEVGEDNGGEGKGFSGTWTKPKGVGSRERSGDGWGGVEWWGGNGDNFT